MAAIFTTTVTGLRTAASQGSLVDVVTEVNWMVVAQDGNKFARKIGATIVSSPDVSKFIAFPSLTLAEVLNWIPDPATSAVQNELTAQIASQAPPTVTVKRPPWIMPPPPRGDKPSNT